MELNQKIINNLAEHKVSLDEYFYLWCLNEGVNLYLKLGISSDAMLRKLVRRKYILKSDTSLTESAKLLLTGDLEYKPAKKLVERPKEPQGPRAKMMKNFKEFWNTYPTSDKWGTFPRTRVLRSDMTRALRYYVSIITKKKATPTQLLGALKKDLQMKKRASQLKNELKYMPAVCAWLNKAYYEGFLEDEKNINAGDEGKSTKRYGEDIE